MNIWQKFNPAARQQFKLSGIMKKTRLLIVCLCCFASILTAQRIPNTDLEVRKGTTKFEIPFQLVNDFILVDILFNDVFPLKFIFDTGAEHTILTRREITDILQVNYRRTFTLLGADLQTELYAFLAQGVKMELNNLRAINRSILVLAEDYFKFDEISGIKVHGILGVDFFRRFIVEIDYRRQRIILHDPARYSKPKRFDTIPIELHRGKTYAYFPLTLQNDTTLQAKFLLDTGASLALLLYTYTHPALTAPDNVIRSNIGIGLGGYLEGYLGRVGELKMADTPLGGVVTNFQDISQTEIDSSYLNRRNGLIGNKILKRFDLTINYIDEEIYLRPNKLSKKGFEYDKSGLYIAAFGPHLNEFTIVDVIENSPASKVGLKREDHILSINRWPSVFLSLDQLNNRLKKRNGKKIRLRVERNGEILVFTFKLRDLI